MGQIGNVPEIIKVKSRLTDLQEQGLIKEWALPYENLLTRLDAAIFFIEPVEEQVLEKVWSTLGQVPGFNYRENSEKKLSDLPWRVQFDAASPP